MMEYYTALFASDSNTEHKLTAQDWSCAKNFEE